MLLVCLCFAVVPASAQDKKTSDLVFENIAAKYRELSTSAEAVKIADAPVAYQTRFIQPEDNVVKDYGKLRQIALIRHGEPDLKKTGKFSNEEARKFLMDYDSVGIIRPDRPFLTVSRPDDIAIFCSSINRARATADYLFGQDSIITVSPEFREFETSIGKIKPKLKLPIKLWTAAARIKWVLGFESEGVESFAEAKTRARKAAERLDDATEDNSKAVLVAHGFLNRYIREDLEKMGWRVVRDGGHGYLGTTILAKIDDRPIIEKDLVAVNAGESANVAP